MMRRPEQMATDPEEVLHDTVYRREALKMGGGLEAAHPAFTLPHRLVRDYCAVVRILVRTVGHRRITGRHAVG